MRLTATTPLSRMSNRGATAPRGGSARRDLTSGNRRGYGLVRGWRPLCPPREDQCQQTTALRSESITIDRHAPRGDRLAPKRGGISPVAGLNPPRNRVVARQTITRVGRVARTASATFVPARATFVALVKRQSGRRVTNVPPGATFVALRRRGGTQTLARW